MTNPVDTLKALREDAALFMDDEEIAALDAAIAALSGSEQIRTVMRIEHEGRTFSVDGWAGPMVMRWRDAAMGGATTGQVPEGFALVEVAPDEVLIALTRGEGYEDVHPQLVAEDAIGDRWPEYRTITEAAAPREE